jgi:hypothetical protein
MRAKVKSRGNQESQERQESRGNQGNQGNKKVSIKYLYIINNAPRNLF